MHNCGDAELTLSTELPLRSEEFKIVGLPLSGESN